MTFCAFSLNFSDSGAVVCSAGPVENVFEVGNVHFRLGFDLKFGSEILRRKFNVNVDAMK